MKELGIADERAQDRQIGQAASKRDMGYFSQHAATGMVQVHLIIEGMDLYTPFTGRTECSYEAPEKGSACREFFTAIRRVHEGRGQ